ncbi:hypothetical protein U3516DRAFT_531975, partial [Neocallimastix sp. 'constans']
ILGYDYCSSINPEVAFTNEKMVLGGFEDDEWCGIGEMIHDTSIRIKNSYCNHSVWNENEMLILKATSKCLYAMNSQNGRMI